MPRAPLGRFPTPIEKADTLARAIGVRALYIKRDDRSAEPYGGGKPRKLELFLGQALAEGKKEVITVGSVGSHHAFATALYARKLGLETTLLLLPQPPSAEVRDILLGCAKQGAKLILVGTYGEAERRAARAEAASYIPAGGSSPLGNMGFVNAAFELKAQVDRGVMPPPDDIYIALGTLGSTVGLAIGLKAVGLRARIVAVRASSPGTSSRRALARMYIETVELLRRHDRTFPRVELEPDDILIAGDYLGAGYAEPTIKGSRAIELAKKHGLELEHTYTAKAMAALIDRGRREPERIALYWHSHAAQPIDVAGIDIGALPAELRSYARAP